MVSAFAYNVEASVADFYPEYFFLNMLITTTTPINNITQQSLF